MGEHVTGSGEGKGPGGFRLSPADLMALPRYAAMAHELRVQILEQHVYRPGDRLPSEGELSRRYHVSRLTVRQALSVLENEGLIERRQGIGTFVRAHRYQRAENSLLGLYEQLAALGFTACTKVLDLSLVEAPTSVAAELQLEKGTPCHRIERVRLVDDRPIAYQISHIVAQHVPTLNRTDLERRSLYSILEDDYRLELDYAEQTIEAEAADATLARHLQVPRNSPLLLVRRCTWLLNGDPVEHVVSHYRADAISYKHTLRRQRGVRMGHGLQFNS